MVNKYFGTFLIFIIFGFIFTPNLQGQTDNRLNGYWINVTDGIEQGLSINNGNFEEVVAGKSYRKGTYTATGGKLTIEPTHIHGEGINFIFSNSGINLMDYGIESKWYTVNEFILAFRSVLIKMGGTEEDANEFVRSSFSQNRTSNYSVDANTLILLSEFAGNTITLIYNKR